MAFIQKKSQESLLHIDEPEQKDAYFFWKIMELFCHYDGVSVGLRYLIVFSKIHWNVRSE